MPFCYTIDSRKRNPDPRRSKTMKNYAKILYNGGWRSNDLYEIQRLYGLDDFDRDEIANWLWYYEHEGV